MSGDEEQYSLACAKFMGLLTYGDNVTTGDNFTCLYDGSLVIDSERYRPASGQQLNDILARANVNLIKDGASDMWNADIADDFASQDPDRDLAAIKCLCGLLGVDYEQNSLTLKNRFCTVF